MAGFYETHRYLGRHLWVPIDPKKKPGAFEYGIGWQEDKPERLLLTRNRFKAPYGSLEFIPWNELHPVDESYQILSGSYLKVSWRPERKAKFEYLLYTEEDVYRYCVMNDFYFPDFLVECNLVFIVRDWQESDLVSNIDDYIQKWVS